MSASGPHVVIIGGGFGGLAAAQALARAPVRITLIDRRNHHLFQPLLYQVATAALSPAQIAAPIRGVLTDQRNAEVLMGEVTSIDVAERRVQLRDGELSFDYLIVASGATHSYFGHEEWSENAPGLKSVEDALEIRRRFLLAFERAEREENERERAILLTFVVVGAGPTGVELAGAMKEIACKTIPRDFRHVDTSMARVVLIEAQDRVLPSGFPLTCCRRALSDLQRLGIDVRLGTRVTRIDANGVSIESEGTSGRIESRLVLWAAGVRASALGASLGAPLDRAGRVLVNSDLSIPGHPNVFVIGDLAHVKDAKSGEQVPGMCPAAAQMGKHVASLIRQELQRTVGSQQRSAFRYVDKGLLATIGRARAVAALHGRSFGGLLAWLLWAGVHIFFLISFRAKLLVMLDWTWAYFWFERGARLITGEGALPAGDERQEPRSSPPKSMDNQPGEAVRAPHSQESDTPA